MRAAQVIVGVCIFYVQAGCGPTNLRTTSMPDVDSHLVSLTEVEKEGLMSGADPASIACFTLDRKPIVVVWSDAPLCSHGGSSASSGLMTLHGELIYRGSDMKPNRRIAYSGRIQRGENGQITINGATWDLAKGALFLVSGIDSGVQVMQLSRDVSKLTLEPDELVAFGKADPEIMSFFSRLTNPK